MHDLSYIRENIDFVSAKLRDRNAGIDLGPFLTLDEERRAILRDVEGLKQRRNQVNDEVTRLKKAGQDASALLAEMKQASEQLKEKENLLDLIESRVQ